MATPQLATIAHDIHSRLNAEIMRAFEYMPTSGSRFTRFLDDLNTLGKVDAAARSTLLALLYTLCGDRQQAEYYLDNAVRIHASPSQVKMTRITMLLNLGYFSEAIPEVSSIDFVHHGVPKLLMAAAPSNGAFHTSLSLFEQGRLMNILNLPSKPEGIEAAAQIMDQWGETDIEYSQALDFAGEIMRERKLIFQENLIVEPVLFPADGSAAYVKLKFKVAVDLDTSIDMTLEYNERLAQSGRKIPSSMIFEFEGTRQ